VTAVTNAQVSKFCFQRAITGIKLSLTFLIGPLQEIGLFGRSCVFMRVCVLVCTYANANLCKSSDSPCKLSLEDLLSYLAFGFPSH
jgi:hypothetical protein